MRGVIITKMKMNRESGAGQAMLLTILTLGGAILGATTIAGILMLYQIRATTDSESSARAIFAADAGVEWALFDFYCDASDRCSGSQREQIPLNTLTNGATTTVVCYDNFDNPVAACSATTTAASAISKGTFGNVKRAFYVSLTGATAPTP